MKLTVKSSLSKCFDHLDKAREVPRKGRSWAESTAIDFEQDLHANLIAQRANLSGATLRIYSIRGRPDGSGIRNHISHVKHRTNESLRITVGVASGKPTKPRSHLFRHLNCSAIFLHLRDHRRLTRGNPYGNS